MQMGDRVEVVQGFWHGQTGRIVAFSRTGGIIVRLDSDDGEGDRRTFKPHDLERLPPIEWRRTVEEPEWPK